MLCKCHPGPTPAELKRNNFHCPGLKRIASVPVEFVKDWWVPGTLAVVLAVVLFSCIVLGVVWLRPLGLSRTGRLEAKGVEVIETYEYRARVVDALERIADELEGQGK